MSAPRFEKYEIAPCVRLELDDGIECFERRETLRGLTRKERETLIWSLYGWRAGHGVVCVGDFKTQAAALEIYGLITGHTVAQRDRRTVLINLPA